MTRLFVDPGREAAVAVEVRDWNLRLVDRIHGDEGIEVPPGQYVVSMPRPGREDAMKTVVVEAGKDLRVELDAPPTLSASALESVPIPRAAMGMRAPALPWSVRILPARNAIALGRVVSISAEASGDAIDVRLSIARAQGLLFAQVAVPGVVPRSVALPHDNGARSWALRVRPSEDGIWATAVPPASGPVAALARYLAAGQLEEAAELAEHAERLLQDKVADVFGASIGAYALLRMGRRENLHDWPYNLAEWFPWLPDGAVIAAELALLEGDVKRAQNLLETAAERGIPVFSDGLSLLGRRVREGLVDTPKANSVAGLTALMELGQLTVALPGADPINPAGTQQPLERFAPGDGWHSFEGAEET